MKIEFSQVKEGGRGATWGDRFIKTYPYRGGVFVPHIERERSERILNKEILPSVSEAKKEEKEKARQARKIKLLGTLLSLFSILFNYILIKNKKKSYS